MADTFDIERERAEIRRLIEETGKFTAEQHKLMAEHYKLLAEANKFRMERWLMPFVLLFGGLGAFTASFAAVSALLHIAGIVK